MFSLPIFTKEKGITLIEIIVVIFIIAMLLMILVSDFPKIQKQFALSRATYKFAQDLRKVQDMALSGAEIKNKDGLAINAKGYGIFVDTRDGGTAKKYIIYADVASDIKNEGDNEYHTLQDAVSDVDCSDMKDESGTFVQTDCVIEIVNLGNDAPGIVITGINNTNNSDYISINFTPPNPAVSISDSIGSDRAEIGFGFESDPSDSANARTVYIWKSGLIEAR